MEQRRRRRWTRRKGYLAHEFRFILTQKRAAELLGISPRKLREMRRNYTGPSFSHVGPHIRYAIEDLVKFVDEQHPANTAASPDVED
jgi:hypothetical protein